MLRFPRSNLRMALFGGRVLSTFLLTFFAVPLAFANDAHPPAAQAIAAAGGEQSFLKENEAAMTRMMNDMAVKPTGNIDRDFAAMMIPHHQGAIDMAVLELRYGKDEQLRRIAQEIIVDQMQEIDAMKLAIGEKVSTSAPAPTQPQAPPASENTQTTTPMNMQMDMSQGMKK